MLISRERIAHETIPDLSHRDAGGRASAPQFSLELQLSSVAKQLLNGTPKGAGQAQRYVHPWHTARRFNLVERLPRNPRHLRQACLRKAALMAQARERGLHHRVA